MEKRRRGRPSKVTDAMRTEIIDTFRNGALVKGVMRQFKLGHGTVLGVRNRAVEDGLLDPIMLIRADNRERIRMRRARHDLSELARRSARTRIERGHHWTQVCTAEERSERSRKAARTRAAQTGRHDAACPH
jgi:hypothetical protein